MTTVASQPGFTRRRTTAPANLLMVASCFPPVNEAGVYRSLRFAKYLPELNWKVHVLTLRVDSYEQGKRFDEQLAAQIPDSVTIHRTMAVYPMQWVGRFKKRSKKRKTNSFNESARNAKRKDPNGNPSLWPKVWMGIKDAATLPLMTPDRQIGWLPFAVRRGKQVIARNNIQTLYSSGPPFTNHLAAFHLKRLTGRSWVADFRDPWVNADFGKVRRTNAWALRRRRIWERRVVESADVVIVNTPRSRDDFLARYGPKRDGDPDGVSNPFGAGKFIVIPNGFDPEDFPKDYHHENGWRPKNILGRANCVACNKLLIVHAGRFYGRRNVDGLIEAVGNLCRQGLVDRRRLELRLIGGLRKDRPQEEQRIRRAGVEDVIHLTPLISHDECLKELAAADVLLLVQVGAPLSVPGKTFEYIALGKPVFALADPGATTDLVQAEQLGLCVPPDDVGAIESALLRLYQAHHCGDGLPTVGDDIRRRYDGRRLTEKLDEVLRRLR